MITSKLIMLLNEFWFAPMDAYSRAFEIPIWRNLIFKRAVLDIGCGDGRIDKYLFKGKKINVGLDPSPKSILEASNCKLYKKVIQARAEKIPFKDEVFNTVILNSTFEHIRGDKKAVKEISRVLKRGGMLYFTTTTYNLKKELLNIFNGEELFVQFNKRMSHFHYRSLDQWKNILKKYNMVIVDKFTYFTKNDLKLWLALFRIFTFKIKNREIWSYLKDSKYSKYLPSKLISKIEYLIIFKFSDKKMRSEGLWQYIAAKKI